MDDQPNSSVSAGAKCRMPWRIVLDSALTVPHRAAMNAPPTIGLDDPRNRGVLAYLQARNELDLPVVMLPGDSPRDPYLHLGCHPDVVERLWKGLGAALPQECSCI